MDPVLGATDTAVSLVRRLGMALAGVVALAHALCAPAHADVCAYVTHEQDGTVSVLDTQAKVVTADIDVGGRPTGVAITPDGSLAYVANTDPDAVLAMPTDAAAVTKTISVSQCAKPLCGPEEIGFAPNGSRAYAPAPVEQGAHVLSVVDTTTNTVTGNITIRPDAVPRGGGVAVTADGSKACLTGYLLQSVSGDLRTHAFLYSDVLNIATSMLVPRATDLGAVVDMTAFLDRAQTAAASIPSGMCYVTDGFTGRVLVIDTAGNSVRGDIPLHAALTGVAATPDGRFVYVTGGTTGATPALDEGQVFVIDASTNMVTSTIRLPGRYLTGVAFTPDGALALLTDRNGDRVFVLDTNTKTVTATIPVGSRTRAIAIASLPGACPTLAPSCVGDCDGGGVVTVDELLTMVNIALGGAPISACMAGDASRDGHITVDEILTAVSKALNGC